MRAGELIEEARDFNPAFERRASPDAVALRALSRIQHRLFASVAREDPEVLSRTLTADALELEAALEAGGVLTVPPYITPVDLAVAHGHGQVRVAVLTPSAARRRGAPFPSVSVVPGGLLLTDLKQVGHAKSGWERYEALEYRYVPLPATLITLHDEMEAPEPMHAALVAGLAQWLAVRAGVTNQGFDDRARAAEAEYLEAVRQQGAATSWAVERVVA